MNNLVNEYGQVHTLVEKLRRKVINFVALNPQGEQLGKVKDLILDHNRQLHLVVSQMKNQPSTRSVLIVSKLIKKIEIADKAVVIDISQAAIENLPDYEGIGNMNALSSNEGSDQESDRLSEPIQPMPESLLEAPMLQNEVPEINLQSFEDTTDLTEDIIRLLGERIVVERSKRKVGEVVVRKEIETRMVEVPVRYEKLIVEQVSPEYKQLAEVNLGEITSEAEVNLGGIASEAKVTASDDALTVSGSFNSPKIASLILNAIALERQNGCKQISIEIVVENAEQQKTYQEWFDRCSISG